jgi:hypothetical protein
MKSYEKRLPKFTAEASLMRSMNMNNGVAYNFSGYYNTAKSNLLNMAQSCVPNSWCKNTCNPATGEGENCCWRADIQDCVCRPCIGGTNCCGKPRGSSCP